jgi:Uma2 family endonuclease
MRTATRLMTADELWRLPDDHMVHELVRGELRTMAPSGSEHGFLGMRLGARLMMYVESRKLGCVFNSDTGFVLGRDPDTVRAPDTAFVSQARIPAGGLPVKYFPGAPDLAVEVISPSDTLEEVEEKVADYLAAGTRLVWVVNPRRKTVTVYRSPEAAQILRGDDELDGGDVVPGFRCAVAEVFG